MNRSVVLSILLALALSLSVITAQARASAYAVQPPAPGGTPGPPNQGPTPTGTWIPGEGYGPPPSAGQPGGPGLGAQNNAQSGLHGKPTIYRGTISALTASSLTLTLADASSVSLVLTPQTRVRVPGPSAQGDKLLVGMHVVAQVITDGSNKVVRSIMAIPGRPTLAHRVGTVTAYSAGSSITIRAADSSLYSFTLTSGTRILPAERANTLAKDSYVTIIAPRDTSVLGWTATGIVVHPPQP